MTKSNGDLLASFTVCDAYRYFTGQA